MRLALLSALAVLALTTTARAGLGLTPSEAEAAYGPNRLTAPKDADFLRLEISTNMVAISEHTLSNQVRVAIGYLHDDEGDLRGVVARYTFKDVPVPPPAWQGTLLKQNADGGAWTERNLSPGARPLKEFLRSDYQARFRFFQDAPQAVAQHRDYDEAVMGEIHRQAGVKFAPAPRSAPANPPPAQ